MASNSKSKVINLKSKPKLTGERPQQGVTPDSLLALHAAGYKAVSDRLGGGYLLDIGCGQGFESVGFISPEREVVGADYSAEAAQSAQSQFGTKGLKVAQMDALHLGFADESFDAVCSSHLIEHFVTPQDHVREMARVLQGQGTAYVITPNKPADFENPFHVHLFGRDELETLLERYFESVALMGIDAVPAVKDDFIQRRIRANRLLSLDIFNIRHRIPRSWYVMAYTKLLPLAYRLIARQDSGGMTGITVDDWFVTDSLDDTTLVLFAVARNPRRFSRTEKNL